MANGMSKQDMELLIKGLKQEIKEKDEKIDKLNWSLNYLDNQQHMQEYYEKEVRRLIDILISTANVLKEKEYWDEVKSEAKKRWHTTTYVRADERFYEILQEFEQ